MLQLNVSSSCGTTFLAEEVGHQKVSLNQIVLQIIHKPVNQAIVVYNDKVTIKQKINLKKRK